jgi:molybdopterin converting factor small subunit
LKINVRDFAVYRDATGVGSEDLDTLASSAADVVRECAQRHHRLQNYSASLVAINDEMAEWDTELRENDEVLFFPPVAGG